MKYTMLLPLFLLACLASPVAAPQTASEQAENQINQGLNAYRHFQFEAALDHFKRAQKLDPDSHIVVMYLARTLAEIYVPGVPTQENLQVADEAIEAYKQVIAFDPKNAPAFKWLGSLELLTRRFEESKSYYQQASQVDPDDPEAVYSVGVLDWLLSYKRRSDERAKRGLGMDKPSTINQPFCTKLKANNLPLIEDGIKMFSRALELRADYDDAMAYMNLLYRERAEIQCRDHAARANDERQANEWFSKAMEARKRNLEKHKETGLSPAAFEQLLDSPLPPPPPPPPPPKNH